jgi:excinuclease ABC subunit C
MLPQVVKEKLESLPVQPGCYVFRDEAGATLYIGKAKSLRSRVRSYFQEGSSDTRAFLPLLRKLVADLETLVVASEKEAAILENSLIKEHKPRFNVKLRDDKEFLSLRLDPRAAWPRLEVVRKPGADSARYFGPYPSATSARRTLHLVNKHFQLRTCSDTELATRKRPCLQYQIKRCPAPCVYEVDRDAYDTQVRAVGLFLEARHDELSRELGERMKKASRDMRFEEAALYRDQIRAVSNVQESQRLVGDPEVDQDVLGLYREGDLAELVMMYLRRGRVTDTAFFSLKGMELPDDELVGGFLRQYYDDLGEASGVLPDEVLLPTLPEGAEGVAEWLSERRGRKVALLAPQRGKKAELLSLAMENASHGFREKKRAADDVVARLGQIQQQLRLPGLPRRIECVDISHLGGNDTVGAVVALRDGLPDKKRYRTFHVKGVSGGDDYGAMYEVLSRRFRRALGDRPPQPSPQPTPTPALDNLETPDAVDAPKNEDDLNLGEDFVSLTPTPPIAEAADVAPGGGGGNDDGGEREEPVEKVEMNLHDAPEDPWNLPDLFVVDGGRGQLNVALRAARDLGLHGLPIVGLAKERENVRGETLVDRVYLPGQKNGILLRPQSPALFFLARARDEAHRFSNKARERLGKARRLRSELDDIAGVGEKTRKALLSALGSPEAIRETPDARLLEIPGVTAKTLQNLRKRWPSA